MTRSDTSHIEACRRAWLNHFDPLVDACACCNEYFFTNTGSACNTGKLLFDEYRSAITANRDCEHLEAKAAE